LIAEPLSHILFCRRMAENQEHMTAVLRSIPKEAFADNLRYQQCVVKDGYYFEGQ
jgi:hypothetical protein